MSLEPFEPTIIGKSFKFSNYGATDNMTFGGAVVLTDDGLMLIPTSKKSSSGQAAVVHLFGLIGALVSLFMRSVDKVQWPFMAVEYSQVEAGLRTIAGLKAYKPTQKVLIIHKAEIRGFRSSFWKGLRIVCSNNVSIHPVCKRKKVTAMLRALAHRDLDQPAA